MLQHECALQPLPEVVVAVVEEFFFAFGEEAGSVFALYDWVDIEFEVVFFFVPHWLSYFDFIFVVSFSEEKLFSVRNSSEFDGFIFVFFLEVLSEFALFLETLDLQLIFYKVFLVVFLWLKLVLHRLDDLV